MKCSACSANKCKGEYKYRFACLGAKENIKCTCICQVSEREATIARTSSLALGSAAVYGSYFFISCSDLIKFSFIWTIEFFCYLKLLPEENLLKQLSVPGICLRTRKSWPICPTYIKLSTC